jgi:SAM-dependent methyltransferase
MMIECPACGAVTATWDWVHGCASCAFKVEKIDGFEAWAPELAKASSGEFFDPEIFKELVSLENSNFWFQARNELILWALKHYFGRPTRFAEIGCGTGFVLSAVEKALPHAEIYGTELFIKGLQFAAQRCARAKLVQLDARRIPFREHFDVIGIFDVLEHIEDDEAVLTQIGKALVPGGGLLITVPQHQWLWSPVDEAARHVRRYSAAELQSKVIAAGFEILRSTSFVSFLLLAMLAARLGSRKPAGEAAAELRLNKYLNSVFRCISVAEYGLIRRGVNFAVGGSRLLVARRKSG